MNVRLEYQRSFDAAHHLPNHDGKCANWHGHTWTVKVGIDSPSVNPETGMLVDFGQLKGIIDQFDHNTVNNLVDNPTAENIALFFLPRFQRVAELQVDEAKVAFVEVWEGPGSCIRVTP